jgi:glycosyltransferase involved in cell wall biosynthesis
LRFDSSIRDPWALHLMLLESVRRRAHDFDVIHFHVDYHSFPLFSRQNTPFLSTCHGRLDLPELQVVYDMFPDAPVISISDAQRKPLRQANWVRTVHHGLPINLLAPQPVQPGYLAFLGRISPEKQLDAGIRIAQAAGLPLKIAAKVDRADRDYFDAKIKHLLNGPGIDYIGEIGDKDKSAFLSGAIALVLPIDWPEPFGLVMIEAMACGTPVIAFNRGSVPEIIEDGLTGFVVENEAEAVQALTRLPQLSRTAIRKRFEERFTARRMAIDYVEAYEELIGEEEPQRRLAAV